MAMDQRDKDRAIAAAGVLSAVIRRPPGEALEIGRLLLGDSTAEDIFVGALRLDQMLLNTWRERLADRTSIRPTSSARRLSCFPRSPRLGSRSR